MNSFNAEGRNDSQSSLRVLVVDDDRDVADSFSMLVKLWGHDAQVAYDGVSAFHAACAFRPHVMLLDIGMPKVNGFQLAQQLRQQADMKGTILIAVTGHSDQAHRRQAQAAGFDHFLSKPTRMEEMKRLLLVIRQTKDLGPQTSDTMHASDTIRVSNSAENRPADAIQETPPATLTRA